MVSHEGSLPHALIRATLGLAAGACIVALGLGSAAAPFRCAESTPSVPVNPGCFRSFDPPQDGDCTSSSTHFVVQAIRPHLSVAHRVVSLGFWSNDGSTVFPSAGVLVSTLGGSHELTLPAAEELASLQARDLSSGADTTQVVVDLKPADVVVPAGDDVVVFAAVQFPAGGRLTQVGTGPGILADAALPDQDCDFFSLDGGATWQAPFFIPGDPLSEPLDWGFVVHLEPLTGVEAITWSNLKRRYHDP